MIGAVDNYFTYITVSHSSNRYRRCEQDANIKDILLGKDLFEQVGYARTYDDKNGPLKTIFFDLFEKIILAAYLTDHPP